jgi:hypothetical protein
MRRTLLLSITVVVLLANLRLAKGAVGDFLVSSEDSDQVLRYNGATGAFLGVFASGSGLDEARGLRIGPDGNLYVCSNYTNSVLR